MFDPSSIRHLFPIAKDTIYLNHAGVSPPPTPATEAVATWCRDLSQRGLAGAEAWEETTERVRELAAKLVGGTADEIAFVRSTSHGLGLVAEGLRWNEGDEVVVCAEVEYPSNVYPWMHLRDRGVVMRTIASRDGGVHLGDVAAAITERTRLVAVSSVQYASGAAADLKGLAQLCREASAQLVVDGIQSLGIAEIRAREWGIDFLSADSHKWMLGFLGIGVLYVRAEALESLRPVLVGWKSTTDAWNFDRVHFELQPSARRFEEGSIPYPLLAGLEVSLQLLHDIGLPTISAHLTALQDRLEAGLTELGATVGPIQSQRIGAIVARFEGRDAEEIAEALGERGVVVSARRGGLRFAPHVYNTLEEMDEAVDRLGQVLNPGRRSSESLR